MFFFWLNILVKPKVTVGLEANEVNLMIIQIRLCLLLNTGWQCSYNSIWKKIIAGPQCCLSLITQVIIRAHVFCNSFVRNEKKFKKTNKQTKKKTKGGKGREKKRRENWCISIMQPSRGVIVVAYWQVGPEPLVIKKLANNWAKTHRMNIHPPCKGSHACLSTSFLDIFAVKKQTFPFIS